MKKLTCLFALGFLLFNNTLRANEVLKLNLRIQKTVSMRQKWKRVEKSLLSSFTLPV